MESSANKTDLEFTNSRVVPFSRELVWKAYSNPAHLAAWWGPKGFSNTFHDFNFFPGGTWHFLMHGPGGKDYKNENVFVEIVRHEKIVLNHVCAPFFKATFEFSDAGPGKTKIDWTMLFEIAAEYEAVRHFIPQANEQNFDRLEAELASMKKENNTSPDFVIARTFDAPRELLWQAWSDPVHFRHWWGSKGCKVKVHKMEFHEEGICHYSMQAPDAPLMWGKSVYKEITKPERIVFINSFSDEELRLAHHPMMKEWPMQLLTTITFDENNGKTTVTVRWATHDPTVIEQKAFDQNHESMKMGWTGTLDQLEAYLTQAKK